MSSRSQSDPLEYAEETHQWSEVFYFLQCCIPCSRWKWSDRRIFLAVQKGCWDIWLSARRQILIGSKWIVDRQTDAQIWPALIRQPSQRKGQNTYICKYKYKYKCSNRGLAYKVPIWGCVKSGGVGFCPNRAANLFTTSSCSPGKSPSPFSGFARAAFQSASLPWLPPTQPCGSFLYILKIVFR